MFRFFHPAGWKDQPLLICTHIRTPRTNRVRASVRVRKRIPISNEISANCVEGPKNILSLAFTSSNIGWVATMHTHNHMHTYTHRPLDERVGSFFLHLSMYLSVYRDWLRPLLAVSHPSIASWALLRSLHFPTILSIFRFLSFFCLLSTTIIVTSIRPPHSQQHHHHHRTFIKQIQVGLYGMEN